MPLLQWVAVWATCSGVVVLAALNRVGPYVVDLDTFSPCRGKGTILVEFDVKYTFKNNRGVYYGNLTFPYDVDDENLLTSITFRRARRTTGWLLLYKLERYDIMNFLMTESPTVFNSFFGAMGVTGKPMPAGTYHLENFKPMGLKLEKFPELQYGRIRIDAIQSRNGTELCCFQFEVLVKEDTSNAAGSTHKGRSRRK